MRDPPDCLSRCSVAFWRRSPYSPLPMLNWIWAAFFLIAFAAAIVQAVVFGRPEIFHDVVGSLFDSAKTGFEVALGLTGVKSLWLGLNRIGDDGCVDSAIARHLGPPFRPH